MQSDGGVVGIVKPETPKKDAPKANTLQADSVQTATKPGERTDSKTRKTYATALDWEKQQYFGEAEENDRAGGGDGQSQTCARVCGCIARQRKLTIGGRFPIWDGDDRKMGKTT